MTASLLEDRRTFWALAALMLVLFSIANLPWELDTYDQAKQAWTSYEMVTEGHWLYQRTSDDQGLATKPPLAGWMSAAIYEITRSWDIAWRLPSFISATLIAFLLFRYASRACGNVAGLIAFSAFGFNLLSPRLATLVRSDMPLALAIFLIGLLIWKKIRAGTEWRLRDQVYIFGLLTAAMLIKGPIVYAFLLPGIGIFEWWRSRQERLDTARRLRSAWSGPPQDGFAVANWWPWIASLAVFLLWVIGGILFAPGFFDQVVMREFVARFGETIHRPQPLYFYLPHLLHKFAPWSVLMIGIAIFDVASRRWRIGAALREMSAETFWLLCWSLGGLIAMSLIPSKRVDRIFPLIPPLCLLLAAQIGACVSCSHGSASRPSTSVELGVTAHRAVATTDEKTRTGG